MHKYSSITVRIPGDILDEFLVKVSEFAAGKWSRDPVVEENSNSVTRGMGVRYVHYVRPAAPLLELVFLHREGELKLSNVFVEGDRMSNAEHTRVVKDMWESGMKRACAELGLEGSLIPAKSVRPEEGLPAEVVEALYFFAMTVNKDDAASDPDDMERWANALALFHTTKSGMSEDRLIAYLKEKKFPEKVIDTFLRDYELAMTLLPVYDRLSKKEKPVPVH